MEETNGSIPGSIVCDPTFTPTTMEDVAAFHRRNGDLFGKPWGDGQ
jgi:hypothetical protein